MHQKEVLGIALRRRGFLGSTAGLFAACVAKACQAAEEAPSGQRPPVVNPRATDGDEAFEPNWEEKFTLTVGPDRGDLVGHDDKVIQATVDYVARLGGGTVRLLPGTYTLRNSVYLPSRIRLLGSGPESVVTKIASETVAIAADSDWFDQEITLSDVAGFRVGDAVTLEWKNPHYGNTEVVKRTLVARSGKRFKLNDGIRKDLWLSGKPTCSSLFALFHGERTSDVLIENLKLDGNAKNNTHLDGNYGGCVFLQDCNRYTIRGVETCNYNGDGISFQVCHDVVVENCHSHDNADLGLHPGSGCQRPLLKNNRSERNGVGLYWCWGVKYGFAANNRFDGNECGISIGHNDTDNVMRNNDVSNSGKVGILFRDETGGKDFWANRNVVEKNRITNSGGPDDVAIDIQGETKDLKIVGNTLSETREPMNRIGIRISKQAARIELAENSFEGFASDMIDLRRE